MRKMPAANNAELSKPNLSCNKRWLNLAMEVIAVVAAAAKMTVTHAYGKNVSLLSVGEAEARLNGVKVKVGSSPLLTHIGKKIIAKRERAVKAKNIVCFLCHILFC